MAARVPLTKLTPSEVKDANSYEDLGRIVTERIRADCPQVKRVSSYTILGPYDYLDIFEAPDAESADKVAVIIRSFGHATTETWPALSYERFMETTRQLGK